MIYVSLGFFVFAVAFFVLYRMDMRKIKLSQVDDDYIITSGKVTNIRPDSDSECSWIEVEITVNGKKIRTETDNGYWSYPKNLKPGSSVSIGYNEVDMPHDRKKIVCRILDDGYKPAGPSRKVERIVLLGGGAVWLVLSIVFMILSFVK